MTMHRQRNQQFVYQLSEEARLLLEDFEARNGKVLSRATPCTAAVAAALDASAEHQRRLRRQRETRARGLRPGTVSGRLQGAGEIPELRISGNWMREAGFDLRQEVEIEVENGKLTIRAVERA
jgi:hypothetical protein